MNFSTLKPLLTPFCSVSFTLAANMQSRIKGTKMNHHGQKTTPCYSNLISNKAPPLKKCVFSKFPKISLTLFNRH